MEPWIFILLTLALTLSLKFLLTKLKPNKPTLPPGPSSIAFFAENVLFQKKSLLELEQIVCELHKTYGPIISLHGLTHTTIFIQDRDIAHQALVQNGAAFADRMPAKEPMRYITCNSHDINSSSYGPLWRILRRNLTSEMLQPSRIRLFGPARQWTLQVLLTKLRTQAVNGNGSICVIENFQFAMFCLFVAMCFGQKIDEKQIMELQAIQYYLSLLYTRFSIFSVLPRITKVMFCKKWNEIVGVRRRQAEIFIPLIRAQKDRKLRGSNGEFLHTYVDSLFELDVPDEGGRKLREDEIVNLCHEFLSAGTDTTSTPLEFIMAELVRHEEIQKRLVEEIEMVQPVDEEIKEDDLYKMPYLKAVIMEGLRRHPPGHFLLPHRVTEDVELNGYLIPKGAEVHFNVMQLALEEKVWEDPMEFRPERFLEHGDRSGKVVDITGSREIKMMPFGAGRRMCPGYGLAILHLEYFVANLVREFEWKTVDGEEVDLSEKFEFTTMMKNPLRAQILPRRNK